MSVDCSILDPLTAREVEVLALLCEGLSNREIADVLVVSPKTVENHVSHILSKLGVANRRRAALHAFTRGLVALPMSETPHDNSHGSCYTSSHRHSYEKERSHVPPPTA